MIKIKVKDETPFLVSKHQRISESHTIAKSNYVLATLSSSKITFSPLQLCSNDELQISHNVNTEPKKNALARDVLGDTFGARKAKNMIKAKHQNNIKNQQLELVGDSVLGIVEDKSKNDLILREKRESELLKSRPQIPPFDSLTDDILKVYSVDKDVAPNHLCALLNIDHFLHIKFKEELKESLNLIYPSAWILEQLHKIMESKEMRPKMKKLKLQKLQFLLELIKFNFIPKKRLQECFSKADSKCFGVTPKEISDWLIANFAGVSEDLDGNKEVIISDQNRDKLFGYILCFVLCWDGFKVDLNLLSKDLKITVTKCGGLFKELGCRISIEKNVTTNKNQKFAKLNLPLSFPKRTK